MSFWRGYVSWHGSVIFNELWGYSKIDPTRFEVVYRIFYPSLIELLTLCSNTSTPNNEMKIVPLLSNFIIFIWMEYKYLHLLYRVSFTCHH